MDDNRRRRQHEQSMHGSSGQGYAMPTDPTQQRRQFGAPGDRFRPTSINTSAAASRGLAGGSTYNGYYQDPVSTFSTGIGQGPMASQYDYGQDARQTQGFPGAYGTGMMYNVPPQFSSRPLQMLATDVTTPYFASDPSASGGASAMGAQPSTSSAASAVYQQAATADRSGLLHYQHSGAMNPMANMAPQQSNAAIEQVLEDQPAAVPQNQAQPMASVEQAYKDYQAELRQVFQNIQQNNLAAAAELLLRVSKWLLEKVTDLGLTVDNSELHADRIRLWDDFNHAWLCLLQRQRDLLDEAAPGRPASGLISDDYLKKMAEELIQLCDGIEPHGLVDYQYGVWEERIVQALENCLSSDNKSGGQSESSAN